MTEVKKWRMVVGDNLDQVTAKDIATFISGFAAAGRYRTTLGAEHFLWKVRNNPSGPGFVTLAVDKEDGRIVGTTTVTRRRIWFRRQLIDGAQIGDTFTDASYQRQGIFTSLVEASRERAIADGVQLIYGTPNSNSLPGYEKKCSFVRKKEVDVYLWLLPLRPGNIVFRRRPSVRGWGWSSIYRRDILESTADLGEGDP